MNATRTMTQASSRTKSIAFVALSVAIMAVSAWVTIPIGPVPITLQMFAFTFAIVLLTPSQCIASVACYLLLGAIGVPVFSGMRGGIGVLAGFTGGYLWGYLIGAAAAVLFLWLVRSRREKRSSVAAAGHFDRSGAGAPQAWSAQEGKKTFGSFVSAMGVEIVAGIIFTAIAYVCGWFQYMLVAGVSPAESFVVCVAPFVVIDLVKIVVACLCARSVRQALQ